MRRFAPLTLGLVACGGGVVAWLGLRWLNDAGGVPSAANNRNPSVLEVAAAPSPGAAKHPSIATAANSRASDTSSKAGASPRSSVGGVPDTTAQPAADGTTPNARALALDEGALTENPAARSKNLNGLLNANGLSCDISAAQGAQWRGGGPLTHSISYTGGPFAYQAMNLESGTATMTGSAGLTGSVNGELDVKVTPTDMGLNFTGFTRSGDLLVVTVYADRDAAGHYRMVMSRHGRQLANESAQFYGTCDSLPTQQ